MHFVQIIVGLAGRFQFIAALCVFFWVSQAASMADSDVIQADISLREFDGSEVRHLSDFNGRIVVLDFFAYWCVPCLSASRELDSGIRNYFSARGGNAHGIPVEVLSVNVESANPERTREFLAQAHLSRAYDDSDGTLLERLNGEGLPFIVILDGHQSTTNHFEWHVVHRQSGLKGVANLRVTIDQIGKERTAQADPTTNRSGGAFLMGGSSSQSAEFGAEFLNTDDLHLSSYRVSARHARTRWDGQLSATYQGFDLKYKPDIVIPTLYFPTTLSERSWGGQVALKGDLVPDWRWLANGGYYDGFADYKSIWLEEFYRQSFSALPGYKETDPWGLNVAGGFRWEYLPAAGFVQAEAGYQRDAVSPSYDKPLFKPLVRGLDLIETWSGRISLENVLTRRLRVRNEFQIIDSTERDLRFAYQQQLNYALGEHWTLKGIFGGTWEPPEFSAYSLDGSVEYDWNERWYVRLFAHGYTDDGLIRDPRIISSAQPSLDTLLVGAGVRFVSGRFAVDLAAGPYFTRYDDLPANAGDFENLYQDRDWWWIKLGLACRF